MAGRGGRGHRRGTDEQTPRPHKLLRKKYRVHSLQQEVIAFAGLHSDRSDSKDAVVSATIVTQASHGPVQWLHDRMPCFLPSEVWDA